MRSGWIALAAGVLFAASAAAESIKGEYLETRNADVWTGPCFANGEMGIVGDKAIMAWKVSEGSFDNVKLDGLSIVAVVAGDSTFGITKGVKTRAVLIVDEQANASQRQALIAMAKKLGGETIQEVVAVTPSKISMATCTCEEQGCASLVAGPAEIETRCLCEADSICGHEELFYPSLSKVSGEHAAYAVKSRYTGGSLGETFISDYARSAIIAKFAL